MSSLFPNTASQESEPEMQYGDKPSLFQQLKPSCLGLLQNASVTPLNTPILTNLLKNLLGTLRSGHAEITPNIVSYVFFPLSAILRRNEIKNFPNQVLEGIFRVLAILGDTWWWTCPLELWDQLLTLASGILLTTQKDSLQWDDETKDAIVAMLASLLEPKLACASPNATKNAFPPADERHAFLVGHSQAARMVPVFGNILNETLLLCLAADKTLQNHALSLIQIVIRHYIHEDLAPAVLPGVVSTTVRVALGSGQRHGWASSDAVAEGLIILRLIITKAMGDSVCRLHGLVVEPCSLDDLAAFSQRVPSKNHPSRPSQSIPVPRTKSWLRASASQVHIALNSLSPILRHPGVKALDALLSLSLDLLYEAHITLSQSTCLLLSFVLSLAASDIAAKALCDLNNLLSHPRVSSPVRENLLNISHSNLNSLPRAIRLQDDAKVEFLASQLEVIGEVTSANSQLPNIFSVLLGPSGGIEKWGWKIIHMLELAHPSDLFVSDIHITIPQLLSGENVLVRFPSLSFRNIRNFTGYRSLERMFRTLGKAAGDSALFSIEWLSQTAQISTGMVRSAALWCSARLLEGYAGVSVDSEDCKPLFTIPKALERLTRTMARNIGETWDVEDDCKAAISTNDPSEVEQENATVVEFTTGLQNFRTQFDLLSVSGTEEKPRGTQDVDRTLHKCLSLQILTILSGTLGSSFSPLLLYSLYPILHSAISGNWFLKASGFAALQQVAANVSYASVPNMLLANFDYALDGISQRLTRHRLDIDAAKVMVTLVTVAGTDIVSRAGDIVEECFDRLDDYHGYKTVVEGLIEVLGKVIDVISLDMENCNPARKVKHPRMNFQPEFESFALWLNHWKQHEKPQSCIPNELPPRTDWSELREKAAEEKEEEEEEKLTHSSRHELAKRILERSIPFLTHKSPVIRSQVLALMASSVPVLSDSALLPSVHSAWPYVMNRLTDEDAYVVSAAAIYIETLSRFAGDFMTSKIWEDTWPRFRKILRKLEAAEAQSALRRWDPTAGAFGALSAYTTSHRLNVAILRTTANAVRGTVVPHDADWEVAVSFRRFLQGSCHEEIQAEALQLYAALKERSEDLVWLVLSEIIPADASSNSDAFGFIQKKWNIKANVLKIFGESPDSNST